MDALVSGIAARAVFIEGEEVFFIEADQPNNRRAAAAKDIPNLLAGATDVVRIPNANEQGAFKTLLDLWNKDRAVRMLEVLLDSNESEKNRIDSANVLQALLEKPETFDDLLNLTFAIPFWDGVDVEGAKDAAKRAKEVFDLVNLLERSQKNIATVRHEWDQLDQTLFESTAHRSRFELSAKDTGCFKALAMALENKNEIDNATFDCYIALAPENNSRVIVNEWTRFLAKIKDRKKFQAITIVAEKEAVDITQSTSASTHQIFRNVIKQQEGVKEQLARGNAGLARRFTDDLVNYQLQYSEPAFAAKSLCSLAQYAKSLGNYSLQLEWVRRATDVAPNDAWAHGQAGDVYLSLYRFNEAIKYFKRAGELGDVLFALVGRARVEKESGNYETSLETFDDVINQFSDDPETYRAWSGKGEVLRDMWKLDDALRVYEAAKSKYPDQCVVWNGHAAVLRDLGQLDAAQQEYLHIKKRFPNDAYGYGGWADIFKVVGEFDAALSAYDEAIELFPEECVPVSGKGDTLSEAGRFEEAIKLFRVAMDKFPYEPSVVSGFGKILMDAGHLDEAIAVSRNAVSRFKFDFRLRAGLANCIKKQGKLEEALSEYDSIIREFPHNLIGLNARANLLKELGQYDEALKAYNNVLEYRPNFKSAIVAKAAILVIQGKLNAAAALLPTKSPRTKTDWIGHHIQGMILLKTNKLEEAITHFTRGLLMVPFFQEMKYYENALALAHVIKSEFEVALKYAAHVAGPVAKILQLHCFGETGKRAEAERVFRDLENATALPVVTVRDELAARIGIINVPRAHNDAWIISSEADLVLAEAA